jgi:CheY-like chemotaxis protein
MKRIVIIDDDPMYQLIVKHLLQKIDKSISVTDYENGADAVAGLSAMPSSEWPHVVFLDINMPMMDGWQFLAEAAEKIPELAQRCSIYMLSTSIDNRDRDRAEAMPAVREYICKPVSQEKLKEIVALL